jgi:hypothetical protein
MTSDQVSDKMENLFLTTTSPHSALQPTSPLLCLPGEVRNMIYEYVFSDQTINTVMDGPSGTIKLSCKTTYDQSDDSYEKYIALTETCRQIHYETYILPWKLCDYKVMSYSFGLWLNRVDIGTHDLVWSLLTDEEKAKLDWLQEW